MSSKEEKRKTRMRKDTALLHRNKYTKQRQTYFLSKQMYCFWWRSHDWYCFPHIGHSCICTEFPKPFGYIDITLTISIYQLKCNGTRWRTGGEVKGKLANGLGSQYPSRYLGTWCIQHYYRSCANLGCQWSTELTPPPN